MTCEGVRDVLLDHVAGRLAAEDGAALRAHLARCEACAAAEREERELTDLLVRELPRHSAPWSLRRRLERTWLAAEPRPTFALRGRRLALAACAAAAVALVSGSAGLFAGRRAVGHDEAGARLAEEAIGDHLRLLRAQQPLEIASGGQHQVKPWFEGRLDFAPPVPAPDVADLRLEGGSVGWFLDRDAAVLAYRLRLHRVTLLVFRSAGLPWPPGSESPTLRSWRGFGAVVWHGGGLGYALVSDVDAAQLRDLAVRFAAATQ